VRRGLSALKGIGKVASTVLVGLAVVLAVALVGVRLLGFEVYTVLSGSMEPAYKTGSVIWVDRCEPDEIEVGDPITFVLNEDLDVATHRVIEIDAESQHFYTQGDANDTPDGSPVHFENLIGEPVFTVPYLGYLVSYVQSPPGCYVALIVAAAALALMLIPDLFDRVDARKREEAEAECRERAVARDRRAQRAGAPSNHDARRPQAQAARAQQRTAPRAAGAPQPRTQPRATAHAQAASASQARPRPTARPAAQAAGRPAAPQPNNPRLRAQAARASSNASISTRERKEARR